MGHGAAARPKGYSHHPKDMIIPVSVTTKTTRDNMGGLASKTPNQGLESSFCCWIAGEGSCKRSAFSQTGIVHNGIERA